MIEITLREKKNCYRLTRVKAIFQANILRAVKPLTKDKYNSFDKSNKFSAVEIPVIDFFPDAR